MAQREKSKRKWLGKTAAHEVERNRSSTTLRNKEVKEEETNTTNNAGKKTISNDDMEQAEAYKRLERLALEPEERAKKTEELGLNRGEILKLKCTEGCLMDVTTLLCTTLKEGAMTTLTLTSHLVQMR